jgi:hypothetical protein
MDRMQEIEEMILAGWGDTAADRIPKDWRTRRPRPELHPSEWFLSAHDDGREFAQRAMGNESARLAAAHREARLRYLERASKPRVHNNRKRALSERAAELRRRMTAERRPGRRVA